MSENYYLVSLHGKVEIYRDTGVSKNSKEYYVLHRLILLFLKEKIKFVDYF